MTLGFCPSDWNLGRASDFAVDYRGGDAHFYDVGVVHSPNRQGWTRLVRIKGANLDHIKRSRIIAA